MWYFAHPYTVLDALSRPNHAAMEANWRLCCLRAARLVEAGWLIYAPVCHTHPIKTALPGFVAEPTEERWYEFDHRFVQAVMFAGIILSPGWQDSGGCMGEKVLFQQLGRPVLYLSDPCIVHTGVAIGPAQQHHLHPASRRTAQVLPPPSRLTL